MGLVSKVGREKIVDYLKSQHNPRTKKEIVSGAGFGGDFDYAIKVLMNEHSEIVKGNVRGRTATYCWRSKKETEEKPLTNAEGYSDPTAGKAIINAMKLSNGKYPMRQQFGEVWSTSRVVGDQEGVLILFARNSRCIVIPVYPTKKSFFDDEISLRWQTKDEYWHFTSMSSICNYSDNILSKRLYSLSEEDKERVREAVIKVFGAECSFETKSIETVEVPVEVEKEVVKEVVREVEVPVQTDKKDIEILLLQQKVEIYERLLFKNPHILQGL